MVRRKETWGMWNGLAGSIWRGTVALLLVGVFALPALGGELTVWTVTSGAFVELDGPTRLHGVSPIPLDSRMNGEYDVRITLDGYEEARGRFSLRSRDGRVAVASWTGSLARERFFRSLVLPGYGQIGGGRATAGITWATGCLGAATTSLVLDLRYADAHDAYRLAVGDLQTVASAPVVDEEALVSLTGDAFDLEVESNSRLRTRNAMLAVTGALWAGNLVDAIFFHGGLDVREGSDGVVQIGMNRKTRLRRTVRSALLPGLGQSYGGSPMRGLLYSAAALATGMFALESHLDYRREEDRAEAAAEEGSELARVGLLTAEYSETLDREQRVALAARDDELDRRNAWIAATAVVWGASMLDALFLGPPEGAVTERPVSVSLLDTSRGFSPGVSFRLRF